MAIAWNKMSKPKTSAKNKAATPLNKAGRNGTSGGKLGSNGTSGVSGSKATSKNSAMKKIAKKAVSGALREGAAEMASAKKKSYMVAHTARKISGNGGATGTTTRKKFE